MVNNKIEVLDKGNSEDILIEKLEEDDGITIYRIKVKYEHSVYPQRVSLSFAADGTDVCMESDTYGRAQYKAELAPEYLSIARL